MIPRILYIKENVLNQCFVQRILRPMNYELLEATTGQAGIRIAKAAKPHLILLDLQLEDMPAYEMITHLRQQDDTKRIPVVVITADTTAENYTRCVQAGCNGYLLKPLTSARLLRTLRQFLTHGRTAPLG